MIGMRGKNIALEKYHKLVYSEDHANYINAFKESVSNRENFESEYRMLTRDKQLISCQESWKPSI